MVNRVQLVKDIINNGKNKTWSEYAIEYNAKDSKQANDWWRYHEKNPGFYAPNEPINGDPKDSEPSKYDNLTLKSEWEAQGKGGEVITLRSWKNNVTGEDIEKFRNELLEEIKEFSAPVYEYEHKDKIGHLAEISFPDFHIGRVSVEESKKLYDEIIQKTIDELSLFPIEKIVYVIGNDWLNTDTAKYTTTRGTDQQDVDDYHKTIRGGLNIALSSIYALKSLDAEIDVIILPGNHDRLRMDALGLAIEGYFHLDDQVTIDSDFKYRKYYQYGNTGLMFEHGELKDREYVNVFASEQPQLWADTKHRLVRLGHVHHHVGKEYPGGEISYSPSLAPNSNWEDSKAYISKRRGFIYIHDKKQGEKYRIQIKNSKK